MITIVILIKNAGKKLVHTLDGIFNQVCDIDFEVLAIDSGSTDSSLDILSKYPIRILQISPENFNHGETRNLGASESSKRSEYIVYLTQDAVPYDSQWLQNLIMPLKKDVLVAGAFSRHIPHPTSSPALVRQLTTWWQSGGRTRIIKEMPAAIEEYERNKSFYIYFSNTSSIIRKSVWEVIPWKKVDFAEDAVWADEVLRAGYKIIFEPNSKILHSHDYNFIEQFRQNVDYTNAMIVLFNPEVYNQTGFWFRQFFGIPKQVWLDWKFLMNDEIFNDLGLGRKLYWIFHSPGWHISSSLGAYVGAKLITTPKSVKLFLSRQERIKKTS